MAPISRVLAWKFPWTEGSLVGHSIQGHEGLDAVERLKILASDRHFFFLGGCDLWVFCHHRPRVFPSFPCYLYLTLFSN